VNPEEIQELLAEHENRISFLENSLPGSAMTPKEEEEREAPSNEQPWTTKQWDIVNQLRGELRHLKSKVIALEENKGRGGKYVYK